MPKVSNEPSTNTLPPPPPSLHERITALKADIDAYIDVRVETEHASLSGAPIPRGVLRQLLTAPAGDCRCRQYLHVSSKEE